MYLKTGQGKTQFKSYTYWEAKRLIYQLVPNNAEMENDNESSILLSQIFQFREFNYTISCVTPVGFTFITQTTVLDTQCSKEFALSAW